MMKGICWPEKRSFRLSCTTCNLCMMGMQSVERASTFLFCCLQSKTHVQTLLQRVILVHQTDESPIQRVRQRSAFPPNFIHSIDSSHMMLTAIACQRAGQSINALCTPCLSMHHHCQALSSSHAGLMQWALCCNMFQEL